MYILDRLTTNAGERYAGFTFPSLRHLLTDIESKPNIVALGVRAWQSPIGLVLAEIENEHTAIIRSISVAKPYRNQGIGTSLLQSLERTLQHRGCTSAQIRHFGDGGLNRQLTGLLYKNGWPKLEAQGIFCQSDYNTLSQAPWMKHRSVPPGFEIFLWKDLTRLERAHMLEEQRVAPWYPTVFDPFHEEERQEPATSLGMKFKGKIIGWCILNRLSETGVACTTLFVRNEYQIRGFAVRLLVSTIERTRDTGMYDFFFDVAFNKAAMIAFVRRRMLPYLKSVRLLNVSTKLIAHPSALGASA